MHSFHEQLYKKSGIVITKLARDMLAQEAGARLLSVAEYAQQLGVSRGVVQKALSFLEETGCVEMEKSHGTGTMLRRADAKRLCECAGWESLTVNMPVPSTGTLCSLATALYEQGERFPAPLALVYATGSQNRIQYLQKNVYDAIVVSMASARHYAAQYDFLSQPMVLAGCRYSTPFCACFAQEHCTQVQSGMRVAIDSTSLDYADAARALCAGKSVRFVEMPLISFGDALRSGAVDVIVHRQEAFALDKEGAKRNLTALPPEVTGDSTVPVLLFNRQRNYGAEQFFQKYMDLQQMSATQQKVLSGEMPPRFY